MSGIFDRPRPARIFFEEPNALARASAVVTSAGIVAYPTETFYGLAADPFQADAVLRVLEVKGRAPGSPLPLIAPSIDFVGALFRGFDARARRLAETFWPGPLTLALPAPTGIHPACVSTLGTTAVRVSGGTVAREFATVFGGLLTATSANLSGRPPAATPGEVEEELDGRIDALLDAGRTPGGLPSTVLDLSGTRCLLVREGAIPVSDIETVTGESLLRLNPL